MRDTARALNRIALKVEGKLKESCPVDTGLLRNSIVVSPSSNGLLISMNGYGEQVEYGFSPGTPISAEELKGWCKRVLGDENLAYPVAKYLRKYGKKPNPFIRETLFKHLNKIIQEEI
jgi:hypothetical protein